MHGGLSRNSPNLIGGPKESRQLDFGRRANPISPAVLLLPNEQKWSQFAKLEAKPRKKEMCKFASALGSKMKRTHQLALHREAVRKFASGPAL